MSFSCWDLSGWSDLAVKKLTQAGILLSAAIISVGTYGAIASSEALEMLEKANTPCFSKNGTLFISMINETISELPWPVYHNATGVSCHPNNLGCPPKTCSDYDLFNSVAVASVAASALGGVAAIWLGYYLAKPVRSTGEAVPLLSGAV